MSIGKKITSSLDNAFKGLDSQANSELSKMKSQLRKEIPPEMKEDETKEVTASSSAGTFEPLFSGEMEEKWSEKYKKSIDFKNPKGFSQRAHCQGRKKKLKVKELKINWTS